MLEMIIMEMLENHERSPSGNPKKFVSTQSKQIVHTLLKAVTKVMHDV